MTELTPDHINGELSTVVKATVKNAHLFSDIAYQWMRDGKEIEGATSDTYTITFDDYHDPERKILKDITCKISADAELPGKIPP
jgi:hypothetical protein